MNAASGTEPILYRSAATALDAAIDALIAGTRPVAEPTLRPLVDTAATLRAALPVVPVSQLFEERLARRLAGTPGPWPRRALVLGAVGSAAAASLAGLTAYAVWRAGHRHA